MASFIVLLRTAGCTWKHRTRQERRGHGVVRSIYLWAGLAVTITTVPAHAATQGMMHAATHTATQTATDGLRDDPTGETLEARLAGLTPMELDEVLWLARCIYSETNRRREQELVAWVIRNRYETGYRGLTYRDVVLEPLQFSAFNASTQRRTHILGLNQNSTLPAWREALSVALDVFKADPGDRPFGIRTRHFYSPVSMQGRQAPPWATEATPLDSEALGIDPDRFLFYDRIDTHLDPYVTRSAASDRITAFRAHLEGDGDEESRPRRASRRIGRLQPTGRVLRPARPSVQAPRRSDN